MFESLTFKEKPSRNKPTFDKKDFVPFEVSEITVLSKDAIKVTTIGDKNDEEWAVDIIGTLRAMLKAEKLDGKKSNTPCEKIEHEIGSSTFIIRGDAKAFIGMLEEASYISGEFKKEILADTKFQQMAEAKVPEVKDILAQLSQVYRMLPADKQLELQQGVAAFPQQDAFANNASMQSQRKSPQVK